MKIILKDKFENDPEFVLGRFNLELNPEFIINGFKVLKAKSGHVYLTNTIWNGSEERTNIYLVKKMQKKVIDMWKEESGWTPNE